MCSGLSINGNINSGCYKTFFGGNIDFPQIEKLNKVCSDD